MQVDLETKFLRDTRDIISMDFHTYVCVYLYVIYINMHTHTVQVNFEMKSLRDTRDIISMHFSTYVCI